jgi:hypothetical protein
LNTIESAIGIYYSPIGYLSPFTMENGEVFTPLSDITGQKRVLKVQKPTQQPQQQQTAQSPRTAVHDPDKAKRLGQVHFKAAHGIIVAFFTFILYALSLQPIS